MRRREELLMQSMGHCWIHKAGFSSNPRDCGSILKSNKSLSTIKLLMRWEMRLLHPFGMIHGLEILHLKFLVPDSMLSLEIRMLLLQSTEILIMRHGTLSYDEILRMMGSLNGLIFTHYLLPLEVSLLLTNGGEIWIAVGSLLRSPWLITLVPMTVISLLLFIRIFGRVQSIGRFASFYRRSIMVA